MRHNDDLIIPLGSEEIQFPYRTYTLVIRCILVLRTLIHIWRKIKGSGNRAKTTFHELLINHTRF